MRTALVALVLALVAGEPARAATSLAHADDEAHVALAGDTALIERQDGDGAGVLVVPLDASARAQSRLHVDAEGDDTPVVTLSGSAQRAAITIVKGDELGTHLIGQLFSGPPAGPWTALTPPLTSAREGFIPLLTQVDGDTLFGLEAGGGLETYRETVRESGGEARPIETLKAQTIPAFAGDMEAEITGEDEHTLVVRNWRTGAQRGTDLGDGATSVDVRADGTAVVGFDGGGIVRVAPDGTPAVVSTNGQGPLWAGDRIVFADGDRLLAVDPGGRPRRIGVPTATLGTYDADERHVLWTANGCVLVADLAAPAADAPDPGVCARAELELDPHAINLRVRRNGTTRVPVRCVAAADACRGTLRVALAGHRSAALRFSLPVGRRATLVPRLPRAALRGRGWRPLSARAVVVDPDGRRSIVTRGYYAMVR